MIEAEFAHSLWLFTVKTWNENLPKPNSLLIPANSKIFWISLLQKTTSCSAVRICDHRRNCGQKRYLEATTSPNTLTKAHAKTKTAWLKRTFDWSTVSCHESEFVTRFTSAVGSRHKKTTMSQMNWNLRNWRIDEKNVWISRKLQLSGDNFSTCQCLLSKLLHCFEIKAITRLIKQQWSVYQNTWSSFRLES